LYVCKIGKNICYVHNTGPV